MKHFFGWNSHLGDGFAARCEAVALPRRLATNHLGYAPGSGFAPWLRSALNSMVRRSANESSLRWQTYSVRAGKARTRGAAQGIRQLAGGAVAGSPRGQPA